MFYQIIIINKKTMKNFVLSLLFAFSLIQVAVADISDCAGKTGDALTKCAGNDLNSAVNDAIGIYIGCIVGGICICCVLPIGVFCYIQRKKKAQNQQPLMGGEGEMA